METIIFKIILCSGIVLGLYYLFLAKEKTFMFNRFYLLLGLVFSYSIPFATIETQQIDEKKPVILFEQEIQQQVLQNPVAVQNNVFDYVQLLWIVYFMILVILILKIMYSIIKIKSLKGRKITYQNRTVVLLDQEIAPFSFLNTIYLSESYYKEGKIDERIFLHEEIHVKQKHSFDILFIEVLKAFSWFNPFIYFYKNAMITNHEFLADEEVILKKEGIKNYQELILNEVLKQQNFKLTHQFNFNNTKKRFIMMTKTNSKFAEAKKYLAIPAFTVLAILFAERVSAHSPSSESLIKNSRYVEEKKSVMGSISSEIAPPDRRTKLENDTISPKKNIEAKLLKKKTQSSDSDVPSTDNVSVTSKINSNQEVSTLPEYPGGLNVMRNKVSQNFDGAALKGDEGLLKTNILFTISEQGEVSNITSTGNNEAFNTEAIKAVKIANENVTWKPASKDGNSVAYRFEIPLTMKFESAAKIQ